MQRGMLLIEAAVSLTLLTALGLLLMKLSLNVLAPRQTAMQQVLTDAYLTYERSYAERIPFEDLKGSASPWPQYPNVSVATVEIGRLPGNVPLTGKVTRTRVPDPNNFPIAGGTGTLGENPAGMETWKIQSVLTYKVGSVDYAKSRTVVRTQ